MDLEFEHVAPDGDGAGGSVGGTGELRLGPRRRGWVVAALVAVGAVVAASVAFSGGGDGGTARVTTTPIGSVASTTASTTATTTPGTVSTPPTAPPAPTSSTTPFAPLPFGRPTGLVMYLSPTNGGPFTILTYDVDAGEVHEIELGQDVGWFVRALDGGGGTIVDGGAVVLVRDGRARPLDVSSTRGIDDGPYGRVAPGPDGAVWVRGFNPAAVELVDASGQRTGVRHPLPEGADLFGSMADGRPVVRGGDRVAWAVEPDGSRTRLDGIPEAPVVAGRYVSVACDAAQRCTAIGHLDTDGVVPLGPVRDLSGDHRYAPMPDGPYVAVAIDDELFLLDVRTGTSTPVAAGLRANWTGASREPAVRFLPDGLGLVATTQRGIVFAGLDGRPLGEPLISAAAYDTAILGVGRARAWAP